MLCFRQRCLLHASFDNLISVPQFCLCLLSPATLSVSNALYNDGPSGTAGKLATILPMTSATNRIMVMIFLKVWHKTHKFFVFPFYQFQ